MHGLLLTTLPGPRIAVPFANRPTDVFSVDIIKIESHWGNLLLNLFVLDYSVSQNDLNFRGILHFYVVIDGIVTLYREFF